MSKMVERRRISQEIDRVFKLIRENVDDFDVIFKGAKEAPTKQLKEKFSEELARKLTKLKRFRESVISWANNRDVKDRTNELEDMRLEIEARMEGYRISSKGYNSESMLTENILQETTDLYEKFSVFKFSQPLFTERQKRAMEKEDKIKPFSEKALEMEPKVDPKEKEREALIAWFRSCIYALNRQCEPWEADLERINIALEALNVNNNNTNNGINEKKINFGHQKQQWTPKMVEKSDGLLKKIEQNRSHVSKLELILRALHNDLLTIDDLQEYKLKEKVERYIEAQLTCTSFLPDDQASTSIYDEILLLFDNLDSNLLGLSPNSACNADSSGAISDSQSAPCLENIPAMTAVCSSAKCLDDENCSKSCHECKQTSSNEVNVKKAKLKSKNGRLMKITKRKQNKSVVSPAPNLHFQRTPSTQQQHHNFQQNATTPSKVVTPPAAIRLVENRPHNLPYSAVVASAFQNSRLNSSNDWPSDLEKKELISAPVTRNESSTSLHQRRDSPPNSVIFDADVESELSPWLLSPVQTKNPSAAATISAVKDFALLCDESPKKGAGPTTIHFFNTTSEQPTLHNFFESPTPLPSIKDDYSTTSAFIDAPLACNPLRSAINTRRTAQEDAEAARFVRFMENAALQTPFLSDPSTVASSRTMHPVFKMRQIDASPAHYPVSPSPWMCFQDFYDNLSNDTLLWTFYYMERTVAQRGAISALQKRGWMFHTRDKRWYCRIGERNAVTEDYEEGSFGYMDFEDWRAKTTHGNFAFQYRYRGSPVDPLPYLPTSVLGK